MYTYTKIIPSSFQVYPSLLLRSPHMAKCAPSEPRGHTCLHLHIRHSYSIIALGWCMYACIYVCVYVCVCVCVYEYINVYSASLTYHPFSSGYISSDPSTSPYVLTKCVCIEDVLRTAPPLAPPLNSPINSCTLWGTAILLADKWVTARM
jgi:hypothetical protein